MFHGSIEDEISEIVMVLALFYHPDYLLEPIADSNFAGLDIILSRTTASL